MLFFPFCLSQWKSLCLEDRDCLLSARAAVELNYHCLSGFNLTVVVVCQNPSELICEAAVVSVQAEILKEILQG